MNNYELESEMTITVSHEETIMKKMQRKKQAVGMLVKIFSIFIVIGGALSFLMYFFIVGDTTPKVNSTIESTIEHNQEETSHTNTENNQSSEQTNPDNINSQGQNTNPNIQDPTYQYLLGMRNLNGDGIPKNIEEAVNLLTLSANANYSEAQISLGKLYLNGVEVPQNFQKAIFWLDIASKNNNPEAQYLIGYMYENGLGLEKNLDNAKNFYKIASLKGHQKSIDAIENLKNKQKDSKKIQVDNREVEQYLNTIKTLPRNPQKKNNVEIIIN